MAAADILPVIQTWTRIYASHLSASHPFQPQAAQALASIPANPDGEVEPPKNQLRYMQIFENKGAAMGCSNPHPHCQVWTTSTLPEEPGKELAQMTKYKTENGRHLLADYAKLEIEKQERVVWQNEAFLVVCPWWAVWPFEVLIIAKRHVRALVDLTDEERLLFAQAVQEVTRRYDNLFETNFPYSKTPPPPSAIMQILTRDRLGHPPSAARLHRGGSRDELVPHALLPASPPVRHRPEVPRRIRAHG
jgi:UDPglucose--hexose-1-phosphate uridylyltransferase